MGTGKNSGGHTVWFVRSVILVCWVVLCTVVNGCGGLLGYSDKPLFPSEISSVYVEMFESQSFWRGVEYDLTDALAKRIEADTPYKIITSRDRADSVISGQILSVGQSVISIERERGAALERDLEVRAVVSWKNLKTAELLINNQPVSGSATYSALQKQDFKYASSLAANNLAINIVELMEKNW
ncbi:MAG TPA: LPS assembly lipoprotein LptE [Sedimentisphaerales bacterium]|nr:LPS assembly lipoprotein LptE [Sedimentisphaerales bacterium]